MSVPPLVAWTLARALAGHEVNGEAGGLPEPFKGMARALAEASSPEARAMVWRGVVAARPELVEVLADWRQLFFPADDDYFSRTHRRILIMP